MSREVSAQRLKVDQGLPGAGGEQVRGNNCFLSKWWDSLVVLWVKNLPHNAKATGSITALGRSHMLYGQLSLCATTTEPGCCSY